MTDQSELTIMRENERLKTALLAAQQGNEAFQSELTALRAVIKKADALVKTLEDESLSQFALEDAKAYREVRHG